MSNVRKFGIDPTYNEEVMIGAITQPENEHQHGSGVLMLLVDAWDREVTRDQFVSLAASCLTCIDHIARHSMITNVGAFLELKNAITPADIEVTMASTRESLVASTEDVRKMAVLVSKMAKSGDPIH